MLYKEVESAICRMLNSLEEIHIYVPYGKVQMDLSKAKITYKGGKIHAEWRKPNSDWGTTADIFADVNGEAKIKWFDTCFISIKLAD